MLNQATHSSEILGTFKAASVTSSNRGANSNMLNPILDLSYNNQSCVALHSIKSLNLTAPTTASYDYTNHLRHQSISYNGPDSKIDEVGGLQSECLCDCCATRPTKIETEEALK